METRDSFQSCGRQPGRLRVGWKLIVKLFLICSVINQIDGFIESNLLLDKGNIWEYMAQKVLRSTIDFCLAGGKSVKDILITCLVGVAAHPQSIQKHTMFRDFHLTTTYSTIFNWAPSTDIRDETMFTLHTATVTSAAACFLMEKCSAPRVPTCHNFNNTILMCNHTEAIPFTYHYVKLPL